MRKPILSFGFIYEICLALLVIISIVLDLPNPESTILEWIVWGIFFLDYLYRLFKSENKWDFVKSHPLDFIAILPLSQIFQTARLVRLVRLIRLFAIFNRRVAFLNRFFERYKMDSVLVFVLVMLFLAALPMKWLEPSFKTYGDALWWEIVTITTVGYGDLAPVTTVGRIIAAILMLTGIGVIGLITGTVASILTRGEQMDLPKELKDIQHKMDQYPELDEADYAYMIHKLQLLQTREREHEQVYEAGAKK